MKPPVLVQIVCRLVLLVACFVFLGPAVRAQEISEDLYSALKWRVNGVYSDIAYGNGMYKSADAGETWQHLGLQDTRHIARILVDPRNPDIVLIAALGHSFGPNEDRGVFRSVDGGKTWKKVLYKDSQTGAVDLCFEPGNSRVVYATLWQGIRKPGQKGTSFGPGSGLDKSVPGGRPGTPTTRPGPPGR